MKSLIFFILISMHCCSALRAQDTAKTIDRVYTYDKVYTGQITDDKKGDSLTIAVYSKGSYVIDYKQITKIQYAIDNPAYKAPATLVEPLIMRSARRDTSDALDLVAFNGYRATPRVTDKLIKKRNIGIGLTIGGVCLIGVGAVIYAVTPKQSGGSGGNVMPLPSAGSIAGILMIVCGAGITIPGVAIWGSTAHKLRKAERAE